MVKKKISSTLTRTSAEKTCVKNWKLELQERYGRFISISNLLTHSLSEFNLVSGTVYKRVETFIIIAFKIGEIIKIDISSLDPYRTKPFDDITKFRKLRLLKRAIVKDLEPFVLPDAPEYITVKTVAAFFKTDTKILKNHIIEKINLSNGKNLFGFVTSKNVNKFMREITNSNYHSLYQYKSKPHLMSLKSIPLLMDDVDTLNSDDLDELYSLENSDVEAETEALEREKFSLQVAECIEEISKGYL